LFPFSPAPYAEAEATPRSSKTSPSKGRDGTPSASARSSPAPVASQRPNLNLLRYAADKIVSRFTAANKQERELAGVSSAISKSTSKSSSIQHVKDAYFFPKFLTSRNLLELQIADSFFRRQILVQLLIVLQYLRGFSTTERLKALKVDNLNRTLIPHAHVEDSEVRWTDLVHRG
jgi:THO complex subunit 1